MTRAQAEAHWARREDENELRAALAAWERALAAEANDLEAWRMLARGRFFLADRLAFRKQTGGEAVPPKQLVAAFDSAAEAAERGLRVAAPDVARGRWRGVDAVAESLTAEQLPLAFWWAQSTMLAATTKGVTAVVQKFQPVVKVMQRVAALTPATWYGGPDRYFGTVFCSAPAIVGGDLAKGRGYFEQSLKHAPDFFDTYVLFAALYARPKKDHKLYDELLDHVARTPVDVLPEVAAEQAHARAKAAAERATAKR